MYRIILLSLLILACALVGRGFADQPSNAAHGVTSEQEAQLIRSFLKRIESGQIPESYTWKVQQEVRSEDDARTAFKDFLRENIYAQGLKEKKLSIYEVWQIDDYFFTGVKGVNMPFFLFVKKGSKTVFLDGFNP